MRRALVFISLLFLQACIVGGVSVQYAAAYDEARPAKVLVVMPADADLLRKVSEKCETIKGASIEPAIVDGDDYRLTVRYTKLEKVQAETLKHDLEVMTYTRLQIHIQNE